MNTQTQPASNATPSNDSVVCCDFVQDVLSLIEPSDKGLVVSDQARAQAIAMAKALPSSERDTVGIELIANAIKMVRMARGTGAADQALALIAEIVVELLGSSTAQALLAPVLPEKKLAKIVGAASARDVPMPTGDALEGDDLYAKLLG